MFGLVAASVWIALDIGKIEGQRIWELSMDTFFQMKQHGYVIDAHNVQFNAILYLHNLTITKPLEEVCATIKGPWEAVECSYNYH